MDIAAIMTRDPFYVSPECSLQRAVAIMDEHRLRHLPVVDGGRLIGIISQRDLLNATGWDPQRYFDAAERRVRVVRDSMSVPVETIAPDEDHTVAAARLCERRIGCLPVVERGELVGLLSDTDLLRAYAGAVGDSSLPREREVSVGSVMSRGLTTVEVETSVAAALALCRARRIHHLPVLADGWLVGVVSERDLALIEARGAAGSRTAGAVMTTEIVTLITGARLAHAAEIMVRERIGSVLVTQGGRLVGIVTSSDLLSRFGQLEWGVTAGG